MADSSAHVRPENGPQIQRVHEPDRDSMLAALRVVLGLPRVIPSQGQDDLLSNAS